MSENNEYPVIVIGEKQYLLDYSDITGLEWREIKKLTKLGKHHLTYMTPNVADGIILQWTAFRMHLQQQSGSMDSTGTEL